MPIPIPYVHAGLGALCAAMSLPLILKKVPMNPAFGIRVRKAFVSEQNWFAINAYGGKLFLAFGLFLLLFSYLAQDLAPPPASPWAPVFLVIPLTAILPVLLLIQAYARQLPDR